MMFRRFGATQDSNAYALIIHAMIRNLLLKDEFIEAYRQLAVQMFPLYESAARRKVSPIDRKQLQKLGEHLIQLDEDDQLVATCVSVAVTMQVLLFCTGVEADLLIGVKKLDEKLFAHAWVRMPDGEMIDPQNKYGDLQVTKILRLKEEAERWAVSLG
ncbi:lasso peptide biosynthesis B2 protein [Brevibacillus gelatini]|uniref:lasso peptide biosynthesis B2 protein n=1 Tax=Brevibacillus gelatini TaxID=1655277 RepID=UPI003D818FF0